MRWDIPVVCVNIKHDVVDSQNTTNYLFATAGVQDSNNYMFRPFQWPSSGCIFLVSRVCKIS